MTQKELGICHQQKWPLRSELLLLSACSTILSGEIELKPQPEVPGSPTDSRWGRLDHTMLVGATNILDKLPDTKLRANLFVVLCLFVFFFNLLF